MPRASKTTRESDQLNTRLPTKLKEAVEISADAEDITVTAYVIRALETYQALQPVMHYLPAALLERLSQVSKREERVRMLRDYLNDLTKLKILPHHP